MADANNADAVAAAAPTAANIQALTAAHIGFTNALANPNVNAGAAAAGAAVAGAAAAAVAHVPVTNLHDADTPYDLSSRVGMTARQEASAPLEYKYDGSNSTFPNFINALQQRSRLCNWNAVDAAGVAKATNIIMFGAKHLFDAITSITTAELETARTGRTDARAIQNSEVLYLVLSTSLKGNLNSIFFSQPGNLPNHKDGPLMFKAIASFTTINTLPAAVATSGDLTNLDPAKFKFDIIKINEELSRLLVLHSQGSFGSIVNSDFRLYYMLATYDKIKRPQEWANYVSDWKRQQTNGTLTDPQVLSSEATAKYNELKQFTGEYHPSSQRLEDSLVTMLAHYKKKGDTDKKTIKSPPKGDDDEAGNRGSEGAGGNKPSFQTHTRKPRRDGGEPYEEGATKKWNGETFYFHLATSHKDNKRWFVHTPQSCLTCQRFKKQNDNEEPPNDDETAPTSALSDLTSDASTNVETLLAQAFDMIQGTDNDVVETFIAEALAAIQD